MDASFTSIEETRSSTWKGGGQLGSGEGGRGRLTLEMAEFKVGLGAVLFAPKSRFIVAGGLEGLQV